MQRWRFLRQKKAAIQIQCAVRQRLARAELDLHIEEQVAKEEAELAAIQRRKHAFHLEQRHIAALCLQSAWWNFVERKLKLESPEYKSRVQAAQFELEVRRLEAGMAEWLPLIESGTVKNGEPNVLERIQGHCRRAKAQELHLKSWKRRCLQKWRDAVKIQRLDARRNARLSKLTKTKIQNRKDVNQQLIWLRTEVTLNWLKPWLRTM